MTENKYQPKKLRNGSEEEQWILDNLSMIWR